MANQSSARMSSISTFIARRLASSRGMDNRPGPAVAVASGGLALSLAVMLLAVAITTGFKREITDKISGLEAQIRITSLRGGADAGVPVEWSSTFAGIVSDALMPFASGKEPDIALVAAVAGILKSPSDFAGLAFRASRGGSMTDFESGMLEEGRMPGVDSMGEIAVSATTARELGLAVGDKVSAYFIAAGGAGIRPRRFDVVGVFRSDFGEFDNSAAYCSATSVWRLRGLGETQADAIEIRGIDPERIDDATSALQTALNQAFTSGRISDLTVATPVTSAAAGYFNWLDMLDTNIIVILVLMGCVSALMVIACVLILVLRRVRTIGILKALGATDSRIERVFTLLGGRVVLSGMVIGNAIALAFIWIQESFRLIPLDPANYYLSYVPVAIGIGQWLAVNVGFALLAMCVALLPATLVRRLSPARTMRWE